MTEKELFLVEREEQNAFLFKLCGTKHILQGKHCEDVVDVGFSHGIEVFALADGAGSVAYGKFGAMCTVKAIKVFMLKEFENIYAAEDGQRVRMLLAKTLHKALENEAERLNCLIEDLAATLVVVARCGNKFIIIHIGDGIVLYKPVDSIFKVASLPENGEFKGATYFSNGDINHIRIIKGNLDAAFMLMSDGASECFMEKNKPDEMVNKLYLYTRLFTQAQFKFIMGNEFIEYIRDMTRDDASIIVTGPKLALRFNDNLTVNEKCHILGFDPTKKDSKKKVKVFEKMMVLIENGESFSKIMSQLHIHKVNKLKNMVEKFVQLAENAI